MAASKPASQSIIDQQRQTQHALPFENKTDFANAKKGLIGQHDIPVV